ncbi:B12-binding domain-containing radical SAM protein [[Clostridium] polysaccharolyticum]|uniref:Radical SAM superfamily enzyme YgiQ, UPF0313 family n=1 Tax=[Clostridium] polysaccharolyticum TaxID=29364 RepID=A0A1I0E5R5_9FIRM|nr:radical SAM protein [[Clostridium] polysaccharolyticum]SET39978.1 Radical SAM superfamily enzyme YgiQ, UPF0313 family [[Clostridium] polysaccharolyticum]
MKKLKLISPCAHRFTDKGSAKFHFPPLSLAVLAANTPEEFDIEILDENYQDLDFNDYLDADIIGITSMTATVKRGYEIADLFVKHNIPVIMGGHHVSALPEEALQHCTTVIVGEGDYLWRQVMEEFLAGKNLRGIYQSDEVVQLENLSIPREDLYPKEAKYLIRANTYMTRGCPNNCVFCSVTSFSPKFRKRPVDEVIEEMKYLKEHFVDETNRIVFNDDNPTLDHNYAKELFTKMIPLGLKWQCFAGIDIAFDDELLDLMKKAGCTGALIGFDAMNMKDIESMHKYRNRDVNYAQIVKKIQGEYGIPVIAGVVAGFDNDTVDTFQHIINFLDETLCANLTFNVLYPYPGTQLYEQFKKENRITSFDWDNYVLDGINFIPKNMTQEQLHEGYLKVLEWYSSDEHLERKLEYARKTQMGEIGALMIKDWHEGVKRAYEECLRGDNKIRS